MFQEIATATATVTGADVCLPSLRPTEPIENKIDSTPGEPVYLDEDSGAHYPPPAYDDYDRPRRPRRRDDEYERDGTIILLPVKPDAINTALQIHALAAQNPLAHHRLRPHRRHPAHHRVTAVVAPLLPHNPSTSPTTTSTTITTPTGVRDPARKITTRITGTIDAAETRTTIPRRDHRAATHMPTTTVYPRILDGTLGENLGETRMSNVRTTMRRGTRDAVTGM